MLGGGGTKGTVGDDVLAPPPDDAVAAAEDADDSDDAPAAAVGEGTRDSGALSETQPLVLAVEEALPARRDGDTTPVSKADRVDEPDMPAVADV